MSDFTPEQCLKLRLKLEWTQKEVADAAGISLGVVRNFENRYRNKPVQSNINRIQIALEDGFKFGFGDFVCRKRNVHVFGVVVERWRSDPDKLVVETTDGRKHVWWEADLMNLADCP